MEPEILEDKTLTMMGCVFYGKVGKEWSKDNEIGKLWQRFEKLACKYKILLEKIMVNPNVGYELHIETDDFSKTRDYYVFAGVEVNNTRNLPVEFFMKQLPLTSYAHFITKGMDLSECREFFQTWLPGSNFIQSYPYAIEMYDSSRFNDEDMEDPNSEIDWLIPVKEKEAPSNA